TTTSAARADFVVVEEISHFTLSGGGRVRTMNGVGVDGGSKIRTNGASFCLFRVGSTHQLTILQDGAFAFQHLNHNRARGHKYNQVMEERALIVRGVEALGMLLSEVHHLGSYDFQVFLVETAVDFADHVLGDCVGLDNGERALVCHGISPVSSGLKIQRWDYTQSGCNCLPHRAKSLHNFFNLGAGKGNFLFGGEPAK